MLTVMIRHLDDNNREVLIEAKSIQYIPTGPKAGLLIRLPDDHSTHLGHDATRDPLIDVFIMNNSGKTVAKYSL